MLSENEKTIVNYLRNPLFYVLRKDVKKPNLDELSNDELHALYDKMDKYIDEEGQKRRALGFYDEMYILELLSVKDRLLEEIKMKSEIKL